MNDLTDFLLARIAEDEAAAHKLTLTDRRPVLSLAITVNHPERILAECAAKRAIIELAQKASEVEEEFHDYVWAGAGPKQVEPWTGDAILLSLAAVYKDHPDYRQEWA